MCDFYSAIGRRDGKIFHDSSNSHSVMIENAGWEENTNTRTRVYEFECDVSEVIPTFENIVRNRTNWEDVPERTMKNALHHYQTIYDVLHYIGEIPEEVLKEESGDVRWYLAGRTFITEKVQKILSKDKSEYVRMRLAENTFITEKVQKILSKDESVWIRNCLARNSVVIN